MILCEVRNRGGKRSKIMMFGLCVQRAGLPLRCSVALVPQQHALLAGASHDDTALGRCGVLTIQTASSIQSCEAAGAAAMLPCVLGADCCGYLAEVRFRDGRLHHAVLWTHCGPYLPLRGWLCLVLVSACLGSGAAAQQREPGCLGTAAAGDGRSVHHALSQGWWRFLLCPASAERAHLSHSADTKQQQRNAISTANTCPHHSPPCQLHMHW